MPDALLVLNAGSSSLKFAVFLEQDEPLLAVRGRIEGLPAESRFVNEDVTGHGRDAPWRGGSQPGHQGAIDGLLEWLNRGVLSRHRLVGVGHRVVHGGVDFTGPALIDGRVEGAIERLVPLAPLHQPHNLAAIRAVARLAPRLQQVACFDTAFHRTQPDIAQRFALPRRFWQDGVRRYGFHGLSFEYVARNLPQRRDCPTARTVIAHLGNGASLCALDHGRSVATTMGFTPLDGLTMGTRCGGIDPGVLLHLLDHYQMTTASLSRLLYEQSGLLGVSGLASDMRVLLDSTDVHAVEAVDLFIYRVVRELGSMAAALGGLDALVFTGGIGENAASVRARICRRASWLGIEVDDMANARGGPRITRSGSGVSAWVVPTNEELMIALHTRQVLAAHAVSAAAG